MDDIEDRILHEVGRHGIRIEMLLSRFDRAGRLDPDLCAGLRRLVAVGRVKRTMSDHRGIMIEPGCERCGDDPCTCRRRMELE